MIDSSATGAMKKSQFIRIRLRDMNVIIAWLTMSVKDNPPNQP
jgi:hypothetical protein